jgi:hypothetical protein
MLTFSTGFVHFVQTLLSKKRFFFCLNFSFEKKIFFYYLSRETNQNKFFSSPNFICLFNCLYLVADAANRGNFHIERKESKRKKKETIARAKKRDRNKGLSFVDAQHRWKRKDAFWLLNVR